jgi:hypothetical protein
MKTETKNAIEKRQADLRKKVGQSGFKNVEDFEKGAGLFEGLNITAKNLREKAWRRK